MQVFPEVGEGAQRVSTATSYQAQQPRVQRNEGIFLLFCQRPAPTQPRGAREDAHLMSLRSLAERGQPSCTGEVSSCRTPTLSLLPKDNGPFGHG